MAGQCRRCGERGGRGGHAVAELHAHFDFSFLGEASAPDELVEEAVRLGLHTIGLTDRDGFYGVARLVAETAAAYDMTAVFGAELSIGLHRTVTALASGSSVPAPARCSSAYRIDNVRLGA